MKWGRLAEGLIMIGPGFGDHQGFRWDDHGSPRASCTACMEDWPCGVVRELPVEWRRL